MSDEQIRTGLWKKESDRGSYYSGKVEINGVGYWVNLYRNERKESETQPDLNLILKPRDAQAKPAAKPAAKPVAKPEIDDDFPF